MQKSNTIFYIEFWKGFTMTMHERKIIKKQIFLVCRLDILQLYIPCSCITIIHYHNSRFHYTRISRIDTCVSP